MSKNLTLIKLGGSVITNKEVPMMVRDAVLGQLIAEIAKATPILKNQNELLIVGHGQGSFGHAPAMRYRTIEGFVSEDSAIGMAITQDSAAQLNRIVVNAFLAAELPAVSYLFSNSLVTKKMKPEHWCDQVLKQYLLKGMLPITGGDVIVDSEQGCTIWSTEKVLAYIAEQLNKETEYKVDRIIHVTEVDGVLDSNGDVVPIISERNQAEAHAAITGTKGFDVTGGMWHKIAESLAMVELGVTSYIISGKKPGNLLNCLLGKEFVGTTITK
jgi:isopentenyl phosphate kinase